MSTLSILLGRRDPSETLTLILDLLVTSGLNDDYDEHDTPDDKHTSIIYEMIMRLCFRCAVVHSFLTTIQDDAVQM